MGFLAAGIAGYVVTQLLWAGGLGPIRAFFRPQSVVHKTTKSPFQVLLGCLGRMALLGLGIGSLAILSLMGLGQQYVSVFPFLPTVTTLASREALTVLLVGLTLIIVALGLGASEKGNREKT